MHERAPLLTREDGAIYVFAQLLPAENHPAARPAEGLVDRRRDDVGVRHGTRVLARGHKTREVRHVNHQLCVH